MNESNKLIGSMNLKRVNSVQNIGVRNMSKDKLTTGCYVFQEGDIHYGREAPKGAILVMSGDKHQIKSIVDSETGIGLFSGVKAPFLHTVNSFTKANLPEQAVDALTEWVKFIAHKYSDKDIIFAT